MTTIQFTFPKPETLEFDERDDTILLEDEDAEIALTVARALKTIRKMPDKHILKVSFIPPEKEA